MSYSIFTIEMATFLTSSKTRAWLYQLPFFCCRVLVVDRERYDAFSTKCNLFIAAKMTPHQNQVVWPKNYGCSSEMKASLRRAGCMIMTSAEASGTVFCPHRRDRALGNRG